MDFIKSLFLGSPKKPVANSTGKRPVHYSSANNNDKKLAVSGYYMDMTQAPIGGRPVYNTYSNYVYPAARINLKDRKFNCQQPVWGADCL